MIELRIETDADTRRAVHDALARYPERARRAIMRALRRTLDSAAGAASRLLSRRAGLPQRRIKRRLAKRLDAANLEAVLSISGRRMPAHWFSRLRQTAEGVQFGAAGQTRFVRSAFIQPIRGTRLALVRKTARRYPLALVFGPSLAEIMKELPDAQHSLVIDASDTLNKRLRHELKREKLIGGAA